MAAGAFVLDDIPTEEEADAVMAGLRAEAGRPPETVVKKRNADGTWKVTAIGWPFEE